MMPHRIGTGYSCNITTYWSPSHHLILLLHSEIEGRLSSWPKNRKEFFASMNAFPVTLVPVFYVSNRNISRYLSCRWKNHERYRNTKNTRKKGILSMVVIVIVIVIYFTFRRSMIGNKTFGYGTSLNTCNSYICNTTYNCLMKVKLVIKLALVVRYYTEVQSISV